MHACMHAYIHTYIDTSVVIHPHFTSQSDPRSHWQPRGSSGTVSRRGAHDALETFLRSAQSLDAQNASERWSQAKRFHGQVPRMGGPGRRGRMGPKVP